MHYVLKEVDKEDLWVTTTMTDRERKKERDYSIKADEVC